MPKLSPLCRGMASSASGRDAPQRPSGSGVGDGGEKRRNRTQVKEAFRKKEQKRQRKTMRCWKNWAPMLESSQDSRHRDDPLFPCILFLFPSNVFRSFNRSFLLLSLLITSSFCRFCFFFCVLPAVPLFSFYRRFPSSRGISRTRSRADCGEGTGERRRKECYQVPGLCVGNLFLRQSSSEGYEMVFPSRWFTSREPSPLFFDGCCNSLIFVFATRDSRREQIHRYPWSFPASACLMFGQYFHWICSPTSAHERRVASASLLYRKTDRNPNNRTSKKSCQRWIR